MLAPTLAHRFQRGDTVAKPFHSSTRRGTGFAGPQAGGPLGGQGATRSERPWRQRGA